MTVKAKPGFGRDFRWTEERLGLLWHIQARAIIGFSRSQTL
jgi:hypothetical protein